MAALFNLSTAPHPSGMVKKTISPEDAEARVLGTAIRQLRNRAGLTQAQAAEAYGITHQAWQRYEGGSRRLKFDELERIAGAVQASYEDLMEYRRAALSGQPASSSNVRALPGMVPVYGFAAGAGERITIAAGAEIRYVAMHPAQSGYKQIGVAEVVGESMYPRYKPRELAYFVFDLAPARGDDVVVEMADGTALIKEYAGQKDGRIWLKEFHPSERSFDISALEVKALHTVVG